MKKIFNKKKAFTLVELLAVVAIIAVIAMLIAPSIIKTINGSKQDAYDLQVTRMEASAQNFVSDKRKTITELKTIGTPYDVTLQTLSDAGYIDLPLINPLTGENFNPNTTLVTITKQTNGSYTYEFAIGSSNNPTLVLLGSNPDTIACAASGNYTDPQADVTDPLNPGAANINATTTLSKKNAGAHMLLYSYTSSLPKTVTKTRTVNITNANTPTITVTGGEGLRELTQGGAFTAPTATGSDVCEGAITVNISSNVVPTVPGMYNVTYTATNLGGTTKTTIIDVEVLSSTNLDTSGANVPVVTTNMIPVYWDATNFVWKKADSTNKSTRCLWYNYSSSTKRWANSVTVTAASRAAYQAAARGTTIADADILTFFVWVPRYKYMIPAGSGARTITVALESGTPAKATGDAITAYRTHPAFTFNAVELTGFWFGKFESNGTLANITIKPDTTPMSSGDVSTYFTSSRNMEAVSNIYGFAAADVDTHMMLNSEWGAVAYLSMSTYGLNSEIYKNNSSSGYSGRSGGNVGGSQVQVGGLERLTTGFYTYSGKCATTTTIAPGINANCTVVGNTVSDLSLAYKASSTGTIYGVYDMSGGYREYAMGGYNSLSGSYNTPSEPNHSGFNGSVYSGNAVTGAVAFPATKYYNLYTSTTLSSACSGVKCYGHATSETDGWFSDYGSATAKQFNIYPWYTRGGGQYMDGVGAGTFYFECLGGANYFATTLRVSLLVGAGL